MRQFTYFRLSLISALFLCVFPTFFVYAQQGTYALKFDGTDDHVNIPANASLDFNTGTIEAWIAPGASSNNKCFLSMRTTSTNIRWSAHINQSTGTIGIAKIGDYRAVSVGAITPDVWIHVAIQLGTTNCYVYVNGVYKGATGIGISNVTTGLPLYICFNDAGWPNEYFDGKIDEVRIWNTTRTEAEIKANMHREIGTNLNLVACYKMSDGTGTSLTDNSGNSNTGTLTNGPVWQASGCFAGPGMALDFDGTDDYVNLGDVLESFTTYTTEAWVYWRGPVQTYSEMCSKEKVVSFAIRNQGSSIYKMACNFGDGSGWGTEVISTTSIPTNQWVHLAATRDGSGNVHLYINGIPDASTVVNSSSGGNAENRGVGVKPVGAGIEGPFNGLIDEVRIWNIARTADQIRENMMNTLAGNETGILAYYRMDYRDGNTLYDNSNNALNGTLTNMDAATDWVSSSAFNTWIGSESSTWSAASNWGSSTAPVSTDNVGLYKWNNLSFENTINGTPTVNHLMLSSGSNPTLGSNLIVNGNLLLERDLDLNGKVIALGSSGLLDEGSYRLYGTSGTITTNRTLSNISAQNVGGLGAVMTTSANMGSTVITRGHAIQSGNGNQSIQRYYDISPTTNTGLNATLVFKYNDAEFNGLTESNFKLYRSTNNTTWTMMGGTVDVAANQVTLGSISGFSRWTIGDLTHGLECNTSANAGVLTNVSCIGGSNGSVTVSVISGTSPYTYAWSTSPVQTTSTATGLAIGTYYVTVTDAHSCTATSSATVTQPAQWWPVVTGEANPCQNTASMYTTADGKTNYVWIISAGGSITSGGTSTDHTVSVLWNSAEAQSVSVKYTEGSSPFCAAVDPGIENVTVKPAPATVISGATTVTLGQVVTYSTPYVSGDTYTWNASHGNPELCFPNRNCLTLTWDFPCGIINPGYVKVTETNPATGCSATYTLPITINP